MCGNPFKKSKPKGPSKAELDAIKKTEQDRAALLIQQKRENIQQVDFQSAQQRALRETANQTVPKPPPAPETNKQEAPIISSDSSESKKLKNKKTGRSSLRIPLTTSTAGAGGTGLNIPQG